MLLTHTHTHTHTRARARAIHFVPFFSPGKPFAIFIQDESRENLFYLKDDSLSFFFSPIFSHLTVTGRQLVRRWGCKTMPDEFSFRRVLGSDFIKVLRVACVAICDARKRVLQFAQILSRQVFCEFFLWINFARFYDAAIMVISRDILGVIITFEQTS